MNTPNPLPCTKFSQQRTSCPTPSEQSHVPNRCSCKINTRNAELSRRPRPYCDVIQVHSIGVDTTCSAAHERASGRRAKQNSNTAARAKHLTHTRQSTLQVPLPAQQRTCCNTPSEQSHVPNRRSCEPISRHAELSRRPHPCCTAVQVHSIGGASSYTCSWRA